MSSSVRERRALKFSCQDIEEEITGTSSWRIHSGWEEVFSWNKKDIQTGIHYPIPIGEQELYKNDNLTTKGIINTMDWKDTLLSLPMHPFLTDDEINYVCTSIKEFYNNKKGDTT